jgi:hypothetical protein
MMALGSGRIDKYLYVGIRNVVDTVVVVEFKRSDATLVIVNNSILLANNCKCCVMYLFFKMSLSYVHVIICKPCGVSIMECKHLFLFIIELHDGNVCAKYVL